VPIRDLAAMNASLDNDYGLTRGPNAASTHQLALYVGDPMTTGVEVSGHGYARVSVPASKWLAAADGVKQTNGPVQFPTVTSAWPDSPTHFALFDGDTMWDCCPLITPLDVTSSGPGPTCVPTIFYDDNVLAPELV
jgi:hypothetical protein